jgi:HAE1 family hydrophobic/amphiphilic exporter-1
MLLSVLVALILTPVLCATLLKPVPKGHEPADNAVFFLRPFFRWFDRAFMKTRNGYLNLVYRSIIHKVRYVLVFIVIVAVMGYLFKRMPTAYLPDEDQGILMVQTILRPIRHWSRPKRSSRPCATIFSSARKDAVES